ncbi:MAG: polysaccharide biosynthesis tyrosine autokinase [Planctomycetaceae bacterium]
MSSMTTNPGQAGGVEQDALASSLHALVRFLRTVRLRSGVLLTSILVACILGTLYYVTAPRIYQSNASLYISRLGKGIDDDGGQAAGNLTRDMPTFKKLMSEEEVIHSAIQRLPEQFRTDLVGVPKERWIEAIRKRLSVSSAFNTNVLDLSYRSEDPRTAAAVLHALLAAYGSFINQTHQGSSEDNLETLNAKQAQVADELRQLKEHQAQLRASAPELIDTGKADETLNTVSENIRLLGDEYVKAQQETYNARSMVHSIQYAIHNGEDVLQFALNSVDSIGQGLIEQSVGLGGTDAIEQERLAKDVLRLQGELQDALSKYGENHDIVMRLRAQILINQEHLRTLPERRRQMFQQMSREHLAPRLLQMAIQRLQTAEQAQRDLWQQIASVQERAQQLTGTLGLIKEIDREIERRMLLMDELMMKVFDIDLNKDTAIRTEVSTRPRVSNVAVSPRLVVTAFLSLFLGTLSGVSIIWVLDIMDDRFRTPEELKIQLDTHVLAMVPCLDDLEGEGFDAVLTHARPHSTEAESFRALRTSIEFSSSETGRIVCTSTEPGDGKTTISSNMATAFAQSGKKTLVIDADMRRPGLSTLLGLRDDLGLSQILRGTDDLDEAARANVRSTKVSGLDVISCGPRPVNPAELLASDRFSNLLAWAETRYEQIIVDAPPVLAVSDPLIVGRLVDAVVMVVRPDKDRRRGVIRAAESVRTHGCNLLGIVVNALSHTEADGYGYGYGHGYAYHEATEEDVANGLSMIAAGQTSGAGSIRKAA